MAAMTAVCAGELSRQDKARYVYYFQGAVTKLSTGDERAALDLLLYCKEINPDAAETYFYLADCYEHMGNDSLRMEMLLTASRLSPENDVYKEELIPIYLNSNEIDKAVDIIEKILKTTPERTDMLTMLIQIYDYKDDNERLLETLNRLEVQEGQSEQLTMMKVQVYGKMGDDKRAYSELKSLCDNHPLDLQYRVMLGNWLLRQDRKKEALAQYNSVLSEEPENEMGLLSMMDYYRSEQLDSLADQQRDKILFSPKTQQSTRLLLLKQFIAENEHSDNDSTAVLQLFDRVLQQSDEIEIMDMKLAYMIMKHMPDSIVKQTLTEILDKRPEHSQARLQLMSMANDAGDFDEMIRLAEPAKEYNPDEWAFGYFLGFAYIQKEMYEEATKAMESAVEHINEKDNEQLAVSLYELLGEAYYRLNRKEDAFRNFERCLKVDPDNSSCLNNYAYYLSEENQDLDHAAEMSLKAVKAEPTNSTYLDTYAWVLYVQGRYEEAKIYMQMALDNLAEGEEKTIYNEHMEAIEKALKE